MAAILSMVRWVKAMKERYDTKLQLINDLDSYDKQLPNNIKSIMSAKCIYFMSVLTLFVFY